MPETSVAEAVDSLAVADDVGLVAAMSFNEAEAYFEQICAQWRITSSNGKKLAKNSLIHFMNLNAASNRSVPAKAFTIEGKKCSPTVAYDILAPHQRRFHRAFANLALDLGRAHKKAFKWAENKYNIAAGFGYLIIDVLAYADDLTFEEKEAMPTMASKKIGRASEYNVVSKTPVDRPVRSHNNGYSHVEADNY